MIYKFLCIYYRQLEQYDEFLEGVRQTHPRISYRELTQGERIERIGQIFNIEPDEKGRYNRRKFIAFYLLTKEPSTLEMRTCLEVIMPCVSRRAIHQFLGA